MNPHSFSIGSRPRLACRFVRLWSSIGNTAPARHVATCPQCQAFFAADAELERELRADAVRASAEVSISSNAFAQSIIQAVRRTERPPSRSTGIRTASWLMGGLGTVAAAALAVLVISPRSNVPADGTSVATSSPSEDGAEIAKAVESLSMRLVDTVIPTAGELVAENPLQRELGSVYSDVQSALHFLALNFSPTAPKAALPKGGQI